MLAVAAIWRYLEMIQYVIRCCAMLFYFELLVWPHEVEPWFHSRYRGRVETLDAKYNLIFR